MMETQTESTALSSENFRLNTICGVEHEISILDMNDGVKQKSCDEEEEKETGT